MQTRPSKERYSFLRKLAPKIGSALEAKHTIKNYVVIDAF